MKKTTTETPYKQKNQTTIKILLVSHSHSLLHIKSCYVDECELSSVAKWKKEKHHQQQTLLDTNGVTF